MTDSNCFEFGGVRFVRTVSQQEILEYIDSLSDDKRGDIAKIVTALEAAGLLAIEKVVEEEPPTVDFYGYPSSYMSQYKGQAPAEPKPGSISAGLKVDAGLLFKRQ
jgi:hypothetical protein